MNKIIDGLKAWYVKFMGLSKGKRFSIIAISLSVTAALIYLLIFMTRTEYGLLFSNMSQRDSSAILAKLEEKGVETRVEKSGIFVPKDKVESLRLSLLGEVKLEENSSPLEIITNSGSMISSDFENRMKLKLALQGEIERTIKNYNIIKDATVLLTIPEQSGFAREAKLSKASVSISLEDGAEALNKKQAEVITALVSGAVPNLPKENVILTVDNLILLTDDENDQGLYSNEEQDGIRKKEEQHYEEKVYNLLNRMFGPESVKVAVNIDMNFDRVRRETIDYGEGVVVSEKTSVNTSSNGGSSSSSPVDNNMSNVGNASGSGNSTSSQEQTKNYNVPETKEEYIIAPGKVNKVSVAVILDKSKGILDADTEGTIRSAVANAIGYDPGRGDSISVGSLSFVDGKQDIIDSIEKENAAALAELQKRNMVKNITYALCGLIVVIIVLSILRRMRKQKREAEEREMEELMAKDIEVNEDGEIISKVKEFAPIDFEEETEQAHITREVKKYATEKPEQVVDIIKSWLAEDERG